MSGTQFPTILVIFGATGDLMARKIVPALFALYEEQKLPKLLNIVGFSRRELTNESFRDHVRGILLKFKNTTELTPGMTAFINHFSFQQGNFESRADYAKLAAYLGQVDGEWKTCANKLFYLAVPPEKFKTIFNFLGESKLTEPCSPEEGWTRVIVEKPFGKDAKTAEELDELLGKLFKEIQIYRIDHYLAKEMIQNILNFRFSNNLFESNWSNESIEDIHIQLFESLGVEQRGAFYDGVGAFRDVGQNHLLQMLAFITMEKPARLTAEAIRPKRAEVLQTLVTPTMKAMKSDTFRAQYTGYREILNVKPDSNTETYFKVRCALSGSRWQGVPVTLESGKRLGKQQKQIIVTFKHPTPCLCPAGGEHLQNKVIFSTEPEESIKIQFWAKKPGLEFLLEERAFDFLLRQPHEKRQYIEEYTKLLLDCINGDQTLFISTDEIKAMWRFTDPIVKAWNKNVVPLEFYEPDSSVISEKALPTQVASSSTTKKEIGIIGLGKMGANLAHNLIEKGWRVVGYNRTAAVAKEMAAEGLTPVFTLAEMTKSLTGPKIIWLMVPAGKVVDEMLFGKEGIAQYLKKGDIVIDGGNSFYKDALPRAKKLAKLGVHFLDVGTSGGPSGARNGACLMIGGKKEIFRKVEHLFQTISKNNSYQFFEGTGAGHFVKMVHNGIEYGIMQAIAEGFAILKKSKYKLNLTEVAEIYNNGSVIESRLIAWMKKAFELRGENLKSISGTVGHTGEGAWTVKTAKELKIKTKIIEEALKFRIQSEKKPTYTGKLVSALREQFGGHKVT